jgi:hypothetical protein
LLTVLLAEPSGDAKRPHSVGDGGPSRFLRCAEYWSVALQLSAQPSARVVYPAALASTRTQAEPVQRAKGGIHLKPRDQLDDKNRSLLQGHKLFTFWQRATVSEFVITMRSL